VIVQYEKSEFRPGRYGVKRFWRRQTLIIILVIGVLLAAAIVLYRWAGPLPAVLADARSVAGLIRSWGWRGPLLLILLQILQVVIAPLPGQALGLAAGSIYGPWLGLFYALVGLALGRGLALWLARRFGRPLVERLASKRTLERLDRRTRRRGPAFFFLIFLLPFLPDDAACFIAGLTELNLLEIWLLSIIGGLPGLAVSVWAGYGALQLSIGQLIVLAIILLPIGWAFWRWQEKVEAFMLRLIERIIPPPENRGL
jgi:uncharacterized membrane protein YdjX (TVP38/TMEM64 family)